jgi:phage terminase small subunit
MPRREPDPNPKLGPKMNALVPMRRKFVQALMNQGTRNATQAAAAAGYSQESQGSLRVQAHDLMHDEAVQEAIQEEARRRITTMLPLALETVASIMENPQEGGATRLKAATTVMDRSGVHAVSERINREEPLERDPDQVKRIMALAQILGVPIEQLLGRRLSHPTLMITDAVEEPMTSMEGLEGLI